MLRPLASAASLLLVSLAPNSFAAQQSCGVFSPEFSAGGFDRPPNEFVPFDLGAGTRLVAGGEFTVAGSVQARRVAQWDGSAWAEVGQGFNGDVLDLEAIDLGGGTQLFASGRFQSSGGQTRHRIARWNGSSWAAVGSGLNDVGWALCEYPTPAGNRLVVGGEFTTAGGQPALRVAMWDGASWSAMGAGIGPQFAAQRVLALTMHDDGTGPALYAAGEFPGGVLRFNGTTWTVVGGGLVGTPQSLASFDDGQGNRYLLAGGNFDSGPTSVLKGWNGTAWQDVGLENYSGSVERILVRQETAGWAAYLSGSFEPLGAGISNVRLMARWTPTAIQGFPPLLDRVRTLAFFDAGAGEELYAGGNFDRVPTATEPELQRAARLVAGNWTHVEAPRHPLYPSASTGLSTAVRAWTNPVTGERDLFVGGLFRGAADDPTVTNLARWDGQSFSAVSLPTGNCVEAFGEWRPTPGAAARLVAGSHFGIYSFDGVVWSLLGNANTWAPRAFVEFTPPGSASSRLITVGSGVFFDVPNAAFAAQFDGVAWQALGTGLNAAAEDAVVWDPPGALPHGVVVGGSFGTAGGLAVPGIALWDGTSWQGLPGGGFSRVYDLCVWDDGTGEALYANTDQGLRSFDGLTWTTLGPVAALLEPFDDGSGPALYLSDRSRLRNGVIEAIGSATVNAPYATDAHHWVDQYGISQGLFFVGHFGSQGGTPALRVARYWNPCGYASTYCSAKVNSLGCTPQIGWTGVPSVSTSAPFVISAANVLNQKSGLLFFGTTGRIATAYQGGTLCVRSPIRRTSVRSSGGSAGAPDCSGVLSIDFTPYLQGTLGAGFTLGDTVDGQWWYRDPLASFSIGLTDAIEFQVRP